MTRTILAVVTPADVLDIEMNVQLFSDDNRVYAPVFRIASPKRPLDVHRMHEALIKAATESFHVGGCQGARVAYQSEHSTISIIELDFDELPTISSADAALKYTRI